MKLISKVSLFILIASVGISQSEAKLNVVATLPDYGAIAKEIGGDKVDVTILAKPTEDPHFVDAKPSFILKLNRADAIIEGGAELEMGWLPPLLEGSRNKKLQNGELGHIVAAEGIQLLDIPASADRSKGDVHLMGNPHFMIDPIRAKMVAAHVTDVFSKLDAESASTFQENLKAFNSSVDAKMAVWTKLLAPFKGQSLAAYHDSWVYFAQRFGFVIDTFLEPKPGIPPSPSHLSTVIEKMKRNKTHAILVEPHHDHKIAESVASHTGAKVVNVCQFPGGLSGTSTYVELMDKNIHNIADALTQ